MATSRPARVLRQKPASRPKSLLFSKSTCDIWTTEIARNRSKPAHGFVTDVDKLEMGLFASIRIPRGTLILIEVEGGLPGKLQAKVISCRSVTGNNHIVKAAGARELWRLRITAVTGGRDEAEFPKELVDALLASSQTRT